MTEQEAYQEHIYYTHDTYCRIIICHISFDAIRMPAARRKQECSLFHRFLLYMLAYKVKHNLKIKKEETSLQILCKNVSAFLIGLYAFYLFFTIILRQIHVKTG